MDFHKENKCSHAQVKCKICSFKMLRKDEKKHMCESQITIEYKKILEKAYKIRNDYEQMNTQLIEKMNKCKKNQK